MSHQNVERILGRLVTDEEFRESFASDPGWTLAELQERGVALTTSERAALASTNVVVLEWMSHAVPQRLQKHPPTPPQRAEMRRDPCH
ncbi:MAG TPA: Os1348 family NHLP clan protein [Thermoanaerobaculia bacterium]|nr:Os1348 family NHLP clan protein [Thermoanaerobaculia bacterium]